MLDFNSLKSHYSRFSVIGQDIGQFHSPDEALQIGDYSYYYF